MRIIKSLVFVCLILFVTHTAAAIAAPADLIYPGSVNRLVLDPDKVPEYKVLSKSIGFEYDRQYTYTEYADIKRNNNIGVAGEYDFLLLSTGGTSWEWEATEKFNQVDRGWEMTYYSNHDVTVIHEVSHNTSGTGTLVRILKICKGKNQNLNLE